MSENQNAAIEAEATETGAAPADSQAELRRQIEELRVKIEESNRIIATGKGRLKLETPITMGDRTVDELCYDFTDMTGLEYTEAMDIDRSADMVYRITYRQALALFARSAAKHTDNVDMRDIMENLGVTDALEGVQLATLFFNASTRAGRMRISKK